MPSVLQSYYPEASDRCWRCQEQRGMLLHNFWFCLKLEHSWKEVPRLTQKFGDYAVPEDTTFFLLHLWEIPVRIYKKSVLCHLLDAAKVCIAQRWRDPHPPISFWLNKVEDINTLEDLVLSVHNRQERYSKTWTHWNTFVYSEESEALLEIECPPILLYCPANASITPSCLPFPLFFPYLFSHYARSKIFSFLFKRENQGFSTRI